MIFIGMLGALQIASGILIFMFAPYQILGAAMFGMGVIAIALAALIK